MEPKRRMVAGRTGQYELVANLHTSKLAKHHLAINREAKPDERFVVIKETQDEVLNDPKLSKLFLDEVRVATKFDHPNLVHTLETGKTKRSYFAISEYLYGESLAFLLSKTIEAGKEMPLNLAAYIMARVCDGLHYAHNLRDQKDNPLNILHLNINPRNIVVLYSGEIKLTGFDITRTAFKIVDGFSKGDVAYISPEQGERHELDVSSDVYSLGIVFWEMLAQRALYVRSSQIDTLRAIKSGELPPISKFRPYVSGELEAIATRALQSNRKSRFSTAGKMGAELWKYLEDETHKTSAQGIREYCDWLLAGRIHYKQSLLDKLAQEDLEPKTAKMLRPDTQTSLPIPEQVRAEAQAEPGTKAPPPLPPHPKGARKPEEETARPEPEQPAHEQTIPVLNVAKFEPGKRAVPAEPTEPLPADQPADVHKKPTKEMPVLDPSDLEPSEPDQEAEPQPEPGEDAQDEDEREYGKFEADTAEIPADKLPKVVPEFFEEEEEEEPSKPQIRISRTKKTPGKSRSPAALILVVLFVVAAAVVVVLAWPKITGTGDSVDQPVEPADPVDHRPDRAGANQVSGQIPDAGTSPAAGKKKDVLLTIISEPDGCPVRLDSVLLETKTPIRDLKVKPDQEHLVAVFCPKYKLQAKKTKGAAGDRITLEFQPTLMPASGTLELNSVPWTNVYLGKRKLGITPILGAKLPPGVHKLRLENQEAGISEMVTVTIQAGKKTSMTKRFKQ